MSDSNHAHSFEYSRFTKVTSTTPHTTSSSSSIGSIKILPKQISMTRRYVFLSDVNPNEEKWTIKVRVMRLWKVPIYNQKNQYKCIEMVLLDEKDTTIQASVKYSLMLKYMNELEEGKCYLMHKFVVAKNGGSYKATKHPFKIHFMYSTCLKELGLSAIKSMIFNFISFEEIFSRKIDCSFLIDIVGRVNFVGEIEVTNFNEKERKCVFVQVSDRRNITINLLLWDEFASKITTHSAVGRRPLIMVFQNARLKFCQGVASLSNCMVGSKMWLNSEIPEVIYFKHRHDDSEVSSMLTRSRNNLRRSVRIANDFVTGDINGGLSNQMTPTSSRIVDFVGLGKARNVADDFLTCKVPSKKIKVEQGLLSFDHMTTSWSTSTKHQAHR